MIREKLISADVRNLKEYGYPDVDSSNITTDPIYVAFFRSMLEENKGVAGKQVDDVIDGLLAECEPST